MGQFYDIHWTRVIYQFLGEHIFFNNSIFFIFINSLTDSFIVKIDYTSLVIIY